MKQPGYGQAGGQEGAENKPPTANEQIEHSFNHLINSNEDANTKLVLERILEKQKNKTKESLIKEHI
jgi:hypothetical protein